MILNMISYWIALFKPHLCHISVCVFLGNLNNIEMPMVIPGSRSLDNFKYKQPRTCALDQNFFLNAYLKIWKSCSGNKTYSTKMQPTGTI